MKIAQTSSVYILPESNGKFATFTKPQKGHQRGQR